MAPHCAWADRAPVHFQALRPVQGNGPVVPVCRQYAPAESWETLIPEHPNRPACRGSGCAKQILKLAAAGHTYGDAYHPFEFLTGRPMSSSERYEEWFEKQLGEQIGSLSDGNYSPCSSGPRLNGSGDRKAFSLPLNDGLQFATYKMVDWREHRRPEKGRRRSHEHPAIRPHSHRPAR